MDAIIVSIWHKNWNWGFLEFSMLDLFLFIYETFIYESGFLSTFGIRALGFSHEFNSAKPFHLKFSNIFLEYRVKQLWNSKSATKRIESTSFCIYFIRTRSQEFLIKWIKYKKSYLWILLYLGKVYFMKYTARNHSQKNDHQK